MADMTTKILAVELKADDAVNGIIKLNDAISKNNQQIKDNSALIKQNNKAIADGTGDVMKLTAQNQVLAKSNVELTAKTKVLKDERRVLEKETRNEIKAETEEKGSLRALEAELSNLTLKFNKLGQAERENGVEGKKLKTQINAITNEIKAAEFETQRYYRNVGNYQASILSAIGLNNQFATSIINVASSGKGVKGAFTMMSTGVKAFGKALWSLMTNPAFLAIAGIAGAGMAFKWFYDYSVEAENALRLTKEFVDVSGNELQWLRAEIQATANTYGKDYKETLEAVDVLMSHYGITSQEAMQYINDGFQAGADINGRYLELIKQYAPTFHDAGISASELVAIITQTRSGIFSEQGLDAIKVGSTRIREMSSTTRQALQRIGIDTNEMMAKLRSGEMKTFEALQEVSRHLKAMPNDAQEVGEVMSAVFGRQGKFAAQEMIEGLADIDTNLDNVKAKTGDYGKELDNNRKINADFERELASFFNVGDGGWSLLKTRADSFWKQSLTNGIKKLKEMILWVQNLYKTSAVFRFVAQGIGAVLNVLGVAGSKAAGNLFNSFHAGFKTLGSWIDAMVATFKSGFNAIKKMAAGVGDILKGNIEKGIGEIESGWRTGINNALKGIRKALADTKANWKVSVAPLEEGWQATDRYFRSVNFGNFGSGSFFNEEKEEEQTLDDLRDILKDLINGGNGKPSGGGNRGGSGGSGSSNRDVDAEKARLEQLNKQLLQQAINMELQAKRELAKVSEQGIREYYEAQEEAIREKYKDLGESINDATTAEGKAFKMLIDANTKAMEDAITDFRAAQEKQKLQNQIDAETDAKTRLELQLKQLDVQQEAELKKIVDNEELKNSILAKYAQKRKELTDNFAKQQLEDNERLIQTQIAGIDSKLGDLQKRKKLELQLLDIQMQQELAQYEGNEAMKLAIKEKYLRMQEQLDREYADKERELQYQRYETIATITGGLGELMGEFADDNRAAAVASKVLALGQIMVSQAVAIANAVKAGSNAVNPWQMIAQIAASVTAVTVAMVQAFKSLNQAKFATGGYVEGAGTSTSDSIPVRVSNGESIMNANTTAMFGGLLSSLNQLGGGVPIQVQETATSVKGEDMLARAVARGVAMLPAPVVSVEDINRGQRQVEVMNERATM